MQKIFLFHNFKHRNITTTTKKKEVRKKDIMGLVQER